MWSPRVQSDRARFSEEWRLMLEQTQNIDFWQDTVKSILVENDKVCGVVTSMGIEIKSKSVVLTNGTFLNGVIHIGEKNFGGGRTGEKASTGITEQLVTLGFKSGRMKTGTPPRLDGRSLNYSVMEEQFGDENPGKFSYTETPALVKQRSCHVTYTNDEVHDILRTGFEKSPMFQGRIQGLGPRYCPSIEDKITRFAERERHQIFVEPEGWNTVEVYVNGFSTSLPEDVQAKALHKIKGFEHAKMFRPGYAIEYDFFPPTQLYHSLETKIVENLFFAGQINGTTGYEEAASQGLMAGINAHLKINGKDKFVLHRSEAYIGVLIDDLVTKGTDEPYRMFTSRAEYRILLRQDNADLRLTPKSYEIGLANEKRMKKVLRKEQESKEIIKKFKSISADPIIINELLEHKGSTPIPQKTKLFNILSRPNISIEDIKNVMPEEKLDLDFADDSILQAEILMKYEGYISKEKEMADKLIRLENIELHENFDYSKLFSLSAEAREKFVKNKPKTIGEASKISGVTPSDISILMIYLGR
jgi:tRNA uridine 5-carboxymethylaminomethyl modification enzyme